ncbi:MAG: hypothetical protein BWX87_01015 [Bacteroidetes bacterium ADurb.Bin123]|nr:MAG: hypothetical protein BWX87_01015 [Bacteroidetes bacterium ADurb.Bin123]
MSGKISGFFVKFECLTELQIIDIMKDLDRHDLTDDPGSNFNQDIHSKVIRAGKRTYFFDVKRTRSNELYLIITESKKRFESDGNFFYEKHKIFLYQEDFLNFSTTLQEMKDYIAENQVPMLDNAVTDAGDETGA